MNCLKQWPEPVVRVQTLSESGIRVIPLTYVKPPSDRPVPLPRPGTEDEELPVIDLGPLEEPDGGRRRRALRRIAQACREWGFFQAVNHGVSPEVLSRIRRVWREFFGLPPEVKAAYANSPRTYEGYGSRIGVEKGAALDWGDYFYLNYLPESSRDSGKWPTLPHSCRGTVEEYCAQMTKLSKRLARALSLTLGLPERRLPEAFGGDGAGAGLRVNFYPKCPQPELTLGLSPHSDPGGLTLLLPDPRVPGLQLLKAGAWVAVNPLPDALIVNVGDQIQVLSNAMYRSVEHRVVVNAAAERLSVAFFYNPKGDKEMAPLEELVSPERPPLYPAMTFDEYRLFVRTKGLAGKSQVESLRSPPSQTPPIYVHGNCISE